MGTERVDGLPDELESWVDDRAAAEDLTREEVLHRLVAAHHELEESGGLDGETDSNGVSEVETDATAGTDRESIEREIESIDARVADLEADLDEKITDVRERVIQVKRETDAKAPADHDHPEIAAVERRLSAGFENYEEILEYLTDTTDEHDSKLDRIGSSVLALRSRLSTLEGAMDEREAAADLRREANRYGVGEAACGSCGETVRLGLLDEPRCPHCDAPFDGIDPKRGFFGSNRLTVGDPPALESGSDGDSSTENSPDQNPSADAASDPGGESHGSSNAGDRDSRADTTESAEAHDASERGSRLEEEVSRE
jgi:predicted Zn-ribbon and HTH transcriptional regulator